MGERAHTPGRERPILFSAPMVRALLDGRKTQTRRVLNPQPPAWATHVQELDGLNIKHEWRPWGLFVWTEEPAEPKPLRRWPNDGNDEVHGWHGLKLRIAKGDRLWVRESHYLTDDGHFERAVYAADEDAVREHNKTMERLAGRIDEKVWRRHVKLRPSIHMPRWASRLTLTVTDVRVQRLQEITLGDICAEGLARSIYDFKPVQIGFDAWTELWEQINGAGSWDANPWVAAYTFTVERRNIDAPATAAKTGGA